MKNLWVLVALAGCASPKEKCDMDYPPPHTEVILEEWPQKLTPARAIIANSLLKDEFCLIVELEPGKKFGDVDFDEHGSYIKGRDLHPGERPQRYYLRWENCRALLKNKVFVTGQDGKKILISEMTIIEKAKVLLEYH